MFLVGGAADGPGHGDGAVGRKGDAVEPGHHRIGIGDPFVHARRAGAAEQHLAIGQAPAGVEEDAADGAGLGRREGAGHGIEGHDDDQHQGVHGMAGDDVERGVLAHHPPVVQADHDMGHDLHGGRAQGPEGGLEIRHRAVQVVDLADRLLGADHIHHRGVHPGALHRLGAGVVGQRRVHGHLEEGEVPLEFLDDRKVGPVADFVAPVGPA
ncbi:MAG: hypothetical protein IID50_00745 [Proteobacteria bacterium]|nr:hypothetical protein [Pseudomonadota bacterium]